MAEALRWLATGTGLLSTGGYDLVCQFRSDPAVPRPDVQGLFVRDGPRHGEQGHEAGQARRHPVHGLPDPAADHELGAHLGRRAG